MSIYSPVQNGVDEERHLAAWTEQPDPRRQLADADPEDLRRHRAGTQRQFDGIELIASENYVSSAVLAAMGSVLTNKYAEGYPGKRYYGGCDMWTSPKRIAIQRAKQAIWRRTCQRPAPLRRPGQRSRLPGLPQARRHRARHEAGPGWPSHARLAHEHFRQALQLSSTTAWIRKPNASTTTTCNDWRRRASAQAHRCRRELLPAPL